MATNSVIGTMVEAAAYELSEMGSSAPDESIGGNDTNIDSGQDGTEPGSTEPMDSNSDSSDTNPTETKPDDENPSDITEPTDDSSDETIPGETGPAETVPGETEGDSSDDTGDGVPSDKGDIEDPKNPDEGDAGNSETDKPNDQDDTNDSDGNGEKTYVLIEYLIQWGDTLGEIASHHNTTVAILVALNNIRNADLIYAGDTLLIPVEHHCCTCCQLFEA